MDKTKHIGVNCRFLTGMAGEDQSTKAGWVRHASLIRKIHH